MPWNSRLILPELICSGPLFSSKLQMISWLNYPWLQGLYHWSTQPDNNLKEANQFLHPSNLHLHHWILAPFLLVSIDPVPFLQGCRLDKSFHLDLESDQAFPWLNFHIPIYFDRKFFCYIWGLKFFFHLQITHTDSDQFFLCPIHPLILAGWFVFC